MTTFRIRPSQLQGELIVPPSKSHTMRALLFALMGKGKSCIRNYLASPDTDAMIAAIEHFGARVAVFPNVFPNVSDKVLEIQGVSGCLKSATDVVQAGNSGIIFRFLTALAALLPTYTVITGDHSIRHRPILPLLDALTQLGAFAVSSKADGYAPVIVRGLIKEHKASLVGEDSQFVSALLIAASFLPQRTFLSVSHPGERPWIDLTLFWLAKLGMRVEHRMYEEYEIFGSGAYDGFEWVVPGDVSSAAYPIVAALITDSEITLHNIDLSDVQGDKKCIEWLAKMGAKIEIDASCRSLTVRRGSRLKGVDIDIDACIDMITLLAVAACCADGCTVIRNGKNARFKECDRIAAIASELKKMGAHIEEKEDGLVITTSELRGARVKSYGDHRMTLSLSVAALAARGESIIEDVGCIDKTYSPFKMQLNAMGACIE